MFVKSHSKEKPEVRDQKDLDNIYNIYNFDRNPKSSAQSQNE